VTQGATLNATRRLAPFVLVAAVLILSCIVRIRLADVPLERDEGEHGCAAQMMLEGNAPWKAVYNMKLPGTDAFYAFWLALFGQTAVAIRVGLLLVNAATIILMTVLGKRLFGVAGGAAAGASYGILSLSRNVLGTIAHSTHYVVLFAVLGTLLLLRAGQRTWPVFLSGLIYGLAFLMKQPGIFFAAFGILFLAWRCAWTRAAPSRLAVFLAGVALPYGLLCLFLWRAGVFARFWFWTVTLAKAYTGQFTLLDRLFDSKDALFDMIAGPNLWIWILAGLGLVLACVRKSSRPAGLFAAVFLAFSFGAVAAGGAWESHYFILMLPAIALGTGAWAGSRALRFRGVLSVVPSGLVVAACLWSVVAQNDSLFRMSPWAFSRAIYGVNPFPEALEVSEYIRSHSEPGARIAVLGSEAEIYFYSRRRPATGYLFTYGLMETHRYAASLQGEMMSEIMANRPEYIVFVSVPTSWLVRPQSSQAIFSWFSDYSNANYKKVGVVDISEDAPARFVWGVGAEKYVPTHAEHLYIFQKR
jgi:hypothetical protein